MDRCIFWSKHDHGHWTLHNAYCTHLELPIHFDWLRFDSGFRMHNAREPHSALPYMHSHYKRIHSVHIKKIMYFQNCIYTVFCTAHTHYKQWAEYEQWAQYTQYTVYTLWRVNTSYRMFTVYTVYMVYMVCTVNTNPEGSILYLPVAASGKLFQL